jgi:molybdopterin-guanine dinucleotide biosynthesis protein A
MILGAVLAGGQSTRFGSDKALAELGGHTLLERAVAALQVQCDTVVVVGRSTAKVLTLDDFPGPGAGPLGGVAAALNYALEHGHEAVLTCGVDSVGLPSDLIALLSPAPRYLEAQPVVGLWPASAAGAIEEILFGSGKHSMRAFAEAIRAKPVKLYQNPANINTPADLKAAEEQSHGL